jgi:S1-C subfamily serine protease
VAGVVAVAAGAAFVGWLIGRGDGGPPSLTRSEAAATASSIAAEAVAAAAAAPARGVDVYRAIAASLVVIQVEGKPAEANPGGGATTDDPLVPRATGPGAAADPDPVDSLGTGVVINDDGMILTADHVVADAASIRVTFADGTEANAFVVSSEPDQDVAVLMADARPGVIVPAVMGGGVRIGDEAFAVGHPLGLTGSLSAGVISGLDRTVPTARGTELTGLIQFDAAVNPGSSGGPLLNRAGQVVGIVTALADPSRQGTWSGVGFAVPIATAGGAAGGPSR